MRLPASPTPFESYVSALEASSSSGLSAEQMKGTYREATRTYFEQSHGAVGDVDRFLRARESALISIARTEAKERGFPVPNDRRLAQQVAAEFQAKSRARTEWIRPGNEVLVTSLQSTGGLMLSESALTHRREGAKGHLRGPVGGHGGDVWSVRHEDGSVAAYSIEELRPAQQPKKKKARAWIGDV